MDFIRTNKRGIVTLGVIVAGIVMVAVVVNIIFDGKVLTVSNINAVAASSIIAAFATWGYCFVFALNYMDLSIGAAILLVVYAAGELGNIMGVPGVVIGGLVTGIILMFINFNIFTWTKIPSWVAGLGMCLVYEAIGSKYGDIMQEKGEYVVLLKTEYSALGHAPGIYILLVIGFILSFVLYNRTIFGMNVRSIGDNPAVARAMGVKIPSTIIATGIVCGIFIGCAGFMRESYALRIYTMSGLTSLSIIFPPLATFFLAQVISRWINIIVAVPFCALFIYLCFNILTIAGVPSGTLQEASLGAFVLIFAIIAQHGTKEVVK